MPTFPGLDLNRQTSDQTVDVYQPNVDVSSGLKNLGSAGEDFGVKLRGIQIAYAKSEGSSAAASADVELAKYSEELNKGGSKDGKLFGPTDPNQRTELYNKKAKELNDKYKNALSGDAYDYFEADFGRSVQARSVDLEKQKVKSYHDTIQTNVLKTLDTLSDSYVNSDSNGKVKVQGDIDSTLNVVGVVFGPEAEYKLRKSTYESVAGASIAKMINDGESDKANLMIENGEFDKFISPEEKQEWRKKTMDARRDIKSDPLVVTNLQIRAMAGADVRADILMGVRANKISLSDAKGLLNDTAQFSTIVKAENWAKVGTDYINTSLADKINDTSVQSTAKANGKLEWQKWVVNNPNATPEEAEKEYKGIAGRYGVIDRNQLNIAVGRPKFMPNVKNKAEVPAALEAAWKKLKEEQAAGRLKPGEYDQQKMMILQWKQNNERDQAREAADGTK